MLNRQWFYLTVCGNNSFTYVFHKCDPIPSQGRYKPTLSIEFNLQRFSHTKRVDELSYKRHPVLGTNNSSHSFLKNDYRTTTERSRPGWCLLWEWIQIGNDFTRSSSYFKHYGFRKRLWYVFHLSSRAFLLVVMFLLCFGHVYSHMCPQPAGHQIYFSNHSCMWVRWPPWPQPWHHTLRPFTIRWLQWVKM